MYLFLIHPLISHSFIKMEHATLIKIPLPQQLIQCTFKILQNNICTKINTATHCMAD